MSQTKSSQNYAAKYERMRMALRTRFMNLYLASFGIGFDPKKVSELLNESWIKKQLFENGVIAFAQPQNLKPMAIVFTKGALNYVDEPVTIQATSKGNLMLTESFASGKFALVYANESHKAPSLVVDSYIERIINVEKIINQQIAQFRRGLIANVPGEGNKDDVIKLFNELDEGREEIAIWDDNLGSIGLTVKGSYPPYYVGDLYKYKKELESDLLTQLGIINNAIQKESGVNGSEVQANNIETLLIAQSNEREIKKGLQKVNDLFSLDLKYEEPENQMIGSDQTEEK